MALNSSPQILIPDPGAGKIAVPINAFCVYTFGTLAYTTNVQLEIFYDTLTATYMAGGGNVINQPSDSDSPMTIISGSNHSMLPHKAVKIRTANGDPLVGDGTVDVYITYKIITL